MPSGFEIDEKSFVVKILDKFKNKNKKNNSKIFFSVSCEGDIIDKIYQDGILTDTEKEIFFEDFEITVTSFNNKKKITEVEMTNSSHHMQRDVYYDVKDKGNFKSNLSVTKDNMQLSLLTLNKGLYFPDSKWESSKAPSRISLKTGVYSGRMSTSLENFRVASQFRAKCAGGSEIIRYLISNKRSSYLDYWWAVILIIAITFFIFTQSGKRLKKIRRK